MDNKKMSSKKIGVILMVVFILVLGSFTVYSRGYAQRQKPLVSITFPQSATLVWTYETRSTIEPAAPIYAATGAEWTIEVYIPRSAFEGYMSEVYRLSVEVIADTTYFPETVTRLDRRMLDCGGYLYVYNYTSKLREDNNLPFLPGEGVTVHLTHIGFDSYDFMIPFSAINVDPFTGEDYIFSAHRRSGAWGWEYFVERHTVSYGMPKRIGDLANIVLMGMDITAPVVYWSEWELYDGELVRLWD
jgi:hypothetical protein